MTRFPNPQLARQWQERLERFACSELSIAEFCQLEGYSPASFYQWRRRLAQGDGPNTPRFVPVNFKADELQEQHTVKIQVKLPGGAQVSLPAGVASADCRKLIQAIVDATAGRCDTTNDEVLS